MSAKEEEKVQKLTPIKPYQVRKHEIRNITNRFVEELDRICFEGRVKNITQLEKDLLLPRGKLSYLAKTDIIDVYSVARLKRLYNADFQYILLGIRDEEHSGWMRSGIDLRKYKPFDRRAVSKRHGRKATREKEAAENEG